jgi:hypothetical protein
LVFVSVVSVLPNDVCGLGGLFEIEWCTVEFSVCNNFSIALLCTLKLAGSLVTILSLEGDECRHGFSERLEVMGLEIVDLGIDLGELGEVS